MATGIFAEKRKSMTSFYFPSTLRRLAAKGIDSLIRSVFYLPFIKSFFLLAFTDEDVTISLISLFVMFITPVIYEFVFLVFMQATPGKWLMGLKVVPFSDVAADLDWRQCFLRPFVERLSFFFSLAIYAVAFFRYDRTHLADWIAETRVVQFAPRPASTKIRWFLGSILILVNVLEGVQSSVKMLRVIDWEKGQVELRSLVTIDSLDDEFVEEE